MNGFFPGQEVELDIVDFAFGGQGIAKVSTEKGELVIFVNQAIKGQRILARINAQKRRHIEASIITVIKPSDIEVQHNFQRFSGAPYISIPLEKQRQFKIHEVNELYKRIGKIENPESYFDELITSPLDYFYRNKMEYSFSAIRHETSENKEYDDFALGFKHTGTWWKVENLNHPNGLFDEEFETLLPEIRLQFEKTGFPAWHPPKKEGFYRFLIVRKSFSENQLLVNLVVSSTFDKQFDKQDFANFVKSKLGSRLAGVVYTLNDDVADRAKLDQGPSELLFGKDFVTESILGLQFKISMQSFFQPNPLCAEKLYSKVSDYVQENNPLKPDDVVLDLFCGTGTIAQLVASRLPGCKVIGVDIVNEAIRDAKSNAQLNHVQNVKFHTADVGKFLLEFPQYQGKINTVIMDPPRTGIAPKTLRKVIRLEAKQIVYVSCNPATQSRDLCELMANGYRLVKYSLADQFPHTAHVETIALLKKE
ncbi:MAG: 23S rRNA (uracil(1939)-C(5))-methyltransferase RlmD [Flavobacteriales bacterium]